MRPNRPQRGTAIEQQAAQNDVVVSNRWRHSFQLVIIALIVNE